MLGNYCQSFHLSLQLCAFDDQKSYFPSLLVAEIPLLGKLTCRDLIATYGKEVVLTALEDAQLWYLQRS